MPSFDPRVGAQELGAKYAVVDWTLVLTIQCRQCEVGATLTLVNNQEAACPSCGAVYRAGGMKWDETNPTIRSRVQFGVAAGPPQRAPASFSRILQ